MSSKTVKRHGGILKMHIIKSKKPTLWPSGKGKTREIVK